MSKPLALAARLSLVAMAALVVLVYALPPSHSPTRAIGARGSFLQVFIPH